MAYTVARRTSEIGTRPALGARPRRILWLVLRETFALTQAGVAVRVPLALWAARYARSVLFGIGAADPLTMAVTVATLTGTECLPVMSRRAVPSAWTQWWP